MSREFSARLVASALGVQVLGGCAGGTQLAITPRTMSGRALKIWSAVAEDQGNSVVVSGLVRRPVLRVGPIGGHLHIVASFADGRPDLVADTRWGSIPPRGSRTARYFARLPIADAKSVSNITVSYAAKADVVDTSSGMNP